MDDDKDKDDQVGHVPHGGREDLGPAARPELSHVGKSWSGQSAASILAHIRLQRFLDALAQADPAPSSPPREEQEEG